MAVSLITDFSIPASSPVATAAVAMPAGRRRITPQAGRALEVLGHAIEYLTDEFVHAGGGMSPEMGQIEAVQLLMAMNRQVYYECPQMPSVTARLRAMLHLKAA